MPISIRSSPLFKDLSDREFKAVKSCFRKKEFKKGESLFREGNKCERIFIVESGHVKLYRMALSGREQILETLEHGQTCACHGGAEKQFCSTTAEATSNSTVWFLSLAAYQEALEKYPQLLKSLNRVLSERIKCFSLLIEEVSLKDSKSRVIRFLLDMLNAAQSKSKGSRELQIPFTREEIASRLGTSRETVARNLSQLKREGLIDINPHQIIIRDETGLKQRLT